MAQKLNADLNIIQRSGVEIQIDPLTKVLDIIQQLDDEPNDVGGLSAQQLKAKFDEAGNIIKDYINNSLIPQVLGDGLTEQDRQTDEAERQANEAVRQANEEVRQENEVAREAAEDAREVWEDYNQAKSYVPGNKVYYLGSSYVNLIPCTGVLPTVAANWQMIAKKGADSDEGMSQEDADLRYLKLSGGEMMGQIAVLAPTLPNSPANLRFLQPESISVTRLPDKTGYRINEAFDPSGMVVSAKYFGDMLERVTGYVIDPCVFRDGIEKLTVLYTENRVTKSLELPVYRSTDVHPFLAAELPSSQYWYRPVYTGDMWIMSSGDESVLRSKDGYIWGTVEMPVQQKWGLPVYGGGVVVLFPSGSISSNKAAYSEDGGKTWTQATLPTSVSWSTPMYENEIWFSIPLSNTTTVATYSEDGGKTWKSTTLPSAQSWSDPISGNGELISILRNNMSFSRVMYSEDSGKTWMASYLPVSQWWGTPVYGGGGWVVFPASLSSTAACSEDGGKTWTQAALPSSQSYWGNPVYGDGVWVSTMGGSNKAVYSEDGGKTWTQTTLPTAMYVACIAYAAGVFILFPSNGSIAAYSEDGGKTWTQAALPTSQNWSYAVYAAGVWTAIPNNGSIAAYSEDGGKTWTQAAIPTSQNWASPIYDSGLLFAFPRSNPSSSEAAYSEDRGKTWKSLPLFDDREWGLPVFGGSGLLILPSGQSSMISYGEIETVFSLLPEQENLTAIGPSMEAQANELR